MLKKTARALAIVLIVSIANASFSQGIDVSKFQGTINWKKVASSQKVKFVYVKVSEGASRRDPNCKENVEGARKQKLKVGCYHVYSSKTTAYDQFANFKGALGKMKFDLIPVLDIENHHCKNLNIARVDKLLELMEKHFGAKPMIYTSEHCYLTHFTGKKYKKYQIFVAKYQGTPKGRYTLWQYSEKGKIPGIVGVVDLDKFHKSKSINDILLPSKKKKTGSEVKSTEKSISDTTKVTKIPFKDTVAKSYTDPMPVI